MAKELHYDDVNLIMDGLRSLGSRRKRSVAATVGALFGLASFGSSIYNTAQLNRLNEDRQRIEENQQFLMEELMEQNLRINNITTFIEVQYKAWVKQVKLIQESQRKTVMETMGQQIHLLVQAFRMELTDFLTGITRLMDHRLSPLLVQPQALEEAFNVLRNAARLRNMRPMSEDAGILFQVPTSTFVDDHGRLFAVTVCHLLRLYIFHCMPAPGPGFDPGPGAKVLRLYRYVQAPFLLDEQKGLAGDHQPCGVSGFGYSWDGGEAVNCFRIPAVQAFGQCLSLSKHELGEQGSQVFVPVQHLQPDHNHIEDTCEVKVTYLRNHAVQAVDLAVSNLGREPGSVGDGLQIWKQRHHHIGCLSFKTNGGLSQGFDYRLSLRPDT